MRAHYVTFNRTRCNNKFICDLFFHFYLFFLWWIIPNQLFSSFYRFSLFGSPIGSSSTKLWKQMKINELIKWSHFILFFFLGHYIFLAPTTLFTFLCLASTLLNYFTSFSYYCLGNWPFATIFSKQHTYFV